MVVDGSMTKYHGAGVKKYVLDLMNMVNIRDKQGVSPPMICSFNEM